MAQILPAPARSLKEFRLLPGYTSADGRVQDVSLETKLCRQGDGYLCIRTPFVSAAMQAVTGAVKVGMGIGSGCTTQEVKATGRGQATALLEVAAARAQVAEHTGVYLPLIADGGISGPADMVIALALGADTLMLGNVLARFTESPGKAIRNAAGEWVKEYWMEGSLRARNHRRYAQLPELFFEEGVVGYVPHAGSIYDKLPVILQMVRAALATTGCRTIDALHTHAVLERQSPVALQDSRIHDMVPVHGVVVSSQAD